MLNPDLFAGDISALSELFSKPMSDALLEIYYNALKDLSDEEFKRATSDAAKTCIHMPRPAELRKLARGDTQDQSLDALERVEHAFRAAGKYRSVDFEDKAINAAIRLMGGWPGLCELSEDEWRQFRSREFQKMYMSFSSRSISGDTCAALPGLVEIDSLKNGFKTDAPVMIGARTEAPLMLVEGGET